MSAFSRGEGKKKSIYVPLRSGGLKQRSTGTSSATIVRKIENLVHELREDERWPLLEAVTSKPPRATLLELYRAKASNTLDLLEARLSSVLLKDVRASWLASVAARLGGGEGEHSSVNNYAGQVDSFLALHPDATAADITPARVLAWLASRTKTSPGTRRKYLYAMKSLVAYCLEAGHLRTDPLAGFKAPKKGRRRERWESIANDQRIVDAALPQYRSLFAFIKATGCDVGAARQTLVRDLDLKSRRAFLRNTKTSTRQVPYGEIEAWAIPYLEAAVQGKLPNAPLWPELTRTGISQHHLRCCAAVGVDDYTLKDARHSIGVRMRLAGRSFEAIAQQLGNSVRICAEIYAVYRLDDPAIANALQVAK